MRWLRHLLQKNRFQIKAGNTLSLPLQRTAAEKGHHQAARE